MKGLLLLWVQRDGTNRGEEGTGVGGGSCLAGFICIQGQTEQEGGEVIDPQNLPPMTYFLLKGL